MSNRQSVRTLSERILWHRTGPGFDHVPTDVELAIALLGKTGIFLLDGRRLLKVLRTSYEILISHVARSLTPEEEELRLLILDEMLLLQQEEGIPF